MVSEIIDILQAQASMREAYIVPKISCNEINLMIDRPRVEQILINLLSNAIKFSTMGDQIHVVLNTEKYSFSEEKVTIKVKDFGIGIK